MNHRFTDHVVLVSGATSGIGRVAAERFLREGAYVVFCGFGDEAAAELVALSHGRATYVNVDLCDPAGCELFVDTALAQHGRIDVIINNAASVSRSTLESTDAAFFDAMMALNVRAPMLIMRRALPALRANPAGAVVLNVGSLNAYIGAPNLLAYATSKGALMTLSRNLAAAHRHEGIRVHVFNVGWTHTDGEDRLQKSLGNGDDWAEKVSAHRPIKRLLRPEEIVNAITFYASAEAAVFSGAVIDLDQAPLR
jgi:NAD(P)-dependent dehydrogenase (short-subunit alcohol dehydrogenase family)